MTEGAVVRKLAAILMADVVGCSRMMATDEVGTLEILTRHRKEFIDPTILSFDGRIVKNTGDGFLLEFPSAVEAVRCAVALQQGMASRNAELAGEPMIVFRIGVNIGDVIFQDNDIFGNGVNVAARIEPLADAGGVAISRSTHEQVRDRLNFPFEDKGEIEVKNIDRPIGVLTLSQSMIVGLAPQTGSLSPSAKPRRSKWALLVYGVLAVGLLISGSGLVIWLKGNALSSVADVRTTPASLDEQLRTNLAIALPELPKPDVEKLINDYKEGGVHRSLAIAPQAKEHRWTADWPTRDVAEEQVLERCQMTYGEPCAVIASDETVISPDGTNHWTTRDMERLQYNKHFSTKRIPGMRPSILSRPDVLGYQAQTGPKAIAIHPQGIFSVVTGAATQHQAEEQALKQCLDDPARKKAVGHCLLYAVGNQVVLPLRRTRPITD